MGIGDSILLEVMHLHLVVSNVVCIFVTHVDIVILFQLFDILPPLLLSLDSVLARIREGHSKPS